jgi:hypothetical protein
MKQEVSSKHQSGIKECAIVSECVLMKSKTLAVIKSKDASERVTSSMFVEQIVKGGNYLQKWKKYEWCGYIKNER